MATAVIARSGTRAESSGAVSVGGLIRWSGLAAELGGLCMLLFPVLHPNHDPAGYANPIWIPVHYLPAAGLILATFALFGLLARQLLSAGRLGVIGFTVAVVGSALVVSGTQVEAFIIPFVGLNAPELMQGPPPPGWQEADMLGFLVFTIGYIILGVATFRARVLPRLAGVLLALGGLLLGSGSAVVMFLPQALFVGALIFGLALAWVGYELWTEPQPRQAR